MSITDHYSALGVLPAAELVVIAAASRALAQRYHPDKWQGDPQHAHDKMCEINEAYRVLGNAELRAAYDTQRAGSSADSFSAGRNDETESAFDAALNELEGKWSVAVAIFPDLTVLRSNLEKISNTLAFAFVTILLETKNFNDRSRIAAALERSFLQRYFGSSDAIIVYAKDLILSGERAAAKMLNELVDVMGSDVDPSLLVQNIESKFHIRAKKNVLRQRQAKSSKVLESGDYLDALEFARWLGYRVEEHSSGLLGRNLVITVTHESSAPIEFRTIKAFVSWVQGSLCRN